MKIKLIASDYDGTLRPSGNDVTKKSLEAIEKYESLGGKFVICTGRMLKSLYGLKEKYNLKGFGIAFSGSTIVDFATDKIIREIMIPYAEYIELLKKMEEDKLQIQVYIDDTFYTEYKNEFTGMYENICNVIGVETKEKMSEYFSKIKRPIHKIMCITEHQNVLDKIVEYGKLFPNLYFFSSNDFFLEVGSKEANKGNAVKFLADYYHLSADEVATVGDANNDLPMILYAGCSCAVANATDELKQNAKHILPSNNEDAVAYLIEKICKDEI